MFVNKVESSRLFAPLRRFCQVIDGYFSVGWVFAVPIVWILICLAIVGAMGGIALLLYGAT